MICKTAGILACIIVCFVVCPPAASAQASTETPQAHVNRLNEQARKLLFALPDSSFFYASQALQLADRQGYTTGIADSHDIIGMVFFHQGVYLQSLEHLLKAGDIFKTQHNQEKLAANLNQQGLVYYNIRQPKLARVQHEQALALYTAAGLKNGIAYSLGCLGRLFEKQHQYDTALQYQQKAQAFYEELKDLQGLATILENIGSIYEDREDFTKAREYFQRSLSLNEVTADSLLMIVNLNNLGDTYRKTGYYEQAIGYTNKALALATRLKDRDQASSAYKDLGKAYNLNHQYAQAYENLENGRVIYEEMFAQDAAKQLALLQTLFETELQNNAIHHLENARKLDTFIKIALLAGISLILILAAAIISRQRLKIRRDKEESERSREVYEAQNKLMQAELENTYLSEQKLQQELESRAKSLTSHTLHIMEKNKMLEDIQAKLADSLKEDLQEQRKKIKNLLKRIDHSFTHDKDWDDFRNIFEQVHSDFFDKLNQRSSDLTPADIRLAALFRLNMTSKDMATVLGISQDSLRIARYRLRKKLDLPTGENLGHYLHTL